MANQLPAFVYCAAHCTNEGGDCLAQSSLEKSAELIHRDRPAGIGSLASDLVEAWEMKDMVQAATATLLAKKIEIYIPLCGSSFLTALSVSTEIATRQNAMFQKLIDQKIEPPTLSCKIRIDDRLACPAACSAQKGHAQMTALRDMLKECDGGKPFGFNLWPAPPGVTSGTWLATHFDIHYLDRRCYNVQAAAQDPKAPKFITMFQLLEENRGPSSESTGTLFILDEPTSSAQLQTLPSPPSVRKGQMFQIKPENELAYFGEYSIDTPYKPKPPLEEKYQRRIYWENQEAETMNEIKNASSAKGLLKAGLKFGRNKVDKFVDGQKHGVNY